MQRTHGENDGESDVERSREVSVERRKSRDESSSKSTTECDTGGTSERSVILTGTYADGNTESKASKDELHSRIAEKNAERDAERNAGGNTELNRQSYT